jgi:hypothetical protein
MLSQLLEVSKLLANGDSQRNREVLNPSMPLVDEHDASLIASLLSIFSRL